MQLLQIALLALLSPGLTQQSLGVPGRSAQVQPSLQAQTPFPTGGVTIFFGPPGGTGQVRRFAELDGTELSVPGELSSPVRLIPIDCVGRTELETFLPDRARRRMDIPGAARLELPGRRGNVYLIERILGPGSSSFAFLYVSSDGRLRVLGETPSVAKASPFLERVAVDPSGTSLLVATTPAAGGNLLEIGLESGRTVDRSADLGPITFGCAGLWLNHDWGFGIGAEGILRFGREPGEQAELVPMPAPAPDWFTCQSVVSRNRQWALTTAGAHRAAQHAYVFGASGPAVLASQAPDQLSPAGFLPESLDGPYMAVADDGTCAAWMSEESSGPFAAREVFMAELVPPVPQAPLQVTNDSLFLSTLDEVGILSFLTPDTLLMAVGQQDSAIVGGLENMDMYEVRLTGGNPQITNISLSSGDSEAPFFEFPVLEPRSMRLLPDNGNYLFLDRESETLMGLVAGQSGVQPILSDVKSIEFVEAAGDSLLMSLRRSFEPRPYELYRLDKDLNGPLELLLPGTEDRQYLFPAPCGGDWIGVVMQEVVAADRMARVHVPTGTLELFPLLGSFPAPIGFSPSGSQVFGSGIKGSTATFHLWSFEGVVKQLPTPIESACLLP